MAPSLGAWGTLTLSSEASQEGLGWKDIDVAANGTKGPVQILFGDPDAYTSFNKARPKSLENLGHELPGDTIYGTANGAFTSPGIPLCVL